MMESNEKYSLNAVMDAKRLIFPELPLAYQEMLMLVPVEIRSQDHPKHKAVYGLMQAMARHLAEAREVSTIPADQYLIGYEKEQSEVQTCFRIRGIQQEMSAVRFRLDIHDYRGELERLILENRLLELYNQARILDPQGVSRFEHMIDKKMKKVRIRENGNYRGNETGRNERVREVTVKHRTFRDGEPDRLYPCQ